MQKKVIETLMKLAVVNTFLPLLCLLLYVLGLVNEERAIFLFTLSLSVINVFFLGRYAKYLPKVSSKFIKNMFE